MDDIMLTYVDIAILMLFCPRIGCTLSRKIEMIPIEEDMSRVLN